MKFDERKCHEWLTVAGVCLVIFLLGASFLFLLELMLGL